MYYLSWAITLSIPILFSIILIVVISFASGMFKYRFLFDNNFLNAAIVIGQP